jgi:maleylpyruvate isomerase
VGSDTGLPASDGPAAGDPHETYRVAMVTPARPDEVRAIAFARELDRLVAATDAFLDSLEDLDDDACRAPSTLPGWSRGHVLTHLARNADGLRNLCSWATTGVRTPMYASPEARNADIEAGSGRPADALRADLAESADRLAESLAAVPRDAFEVEMRLGSGAQAFAWELPMLRRRELEIHRADLDWGYGPDDWPDDFTAGTLDMVAPGSLAARSVPVQWLADDTGRVWRVADTGPTLRGPRGQLLAWLVGRGTGPQLSLDPPGTVPESPAWV